MDKERIKQICAEKGLSVSALAKLIGMPQPSLHMILNGTRNTTIETLEKIARGLGVPVSDFFDPRPDFVAMVREHGHTHSFDSRDALREWLSSGEQPHKNIRGKEYFSGE